VSSTEISNDTSHFCTAADAFCNTFEREYEPWAKRVRVPALSELGKYCINVTHKAQVLRTLTRRIEQCNIAHAQLVHEPATHSESQKEQQLHDIEQQREALRVLEQSIRRVSSTK
jgi:flagellar motility protein MotE (MotC chaperone)